MEEKNIFLYCYFHLIPKIEEQNEENTKDNTGKNIHNGVAR